jgi:hypothetical protein
LSKIAHAAMVARSVARFAVVTAMSSGALKARADVPSLAEVDHLFEEPS